MKCLCMYFSLKPFDLPGCSIRFFEKSKKKKHFSKMIEGATFPAIHHLGYKTILQDGNIDAFARDVSQGNR